MRIKNQEKVISRKYYKSRLWKITVRIIQTKTGSIYRNSKMNRYLKFYNKRSEIGSEWEYVNSSIYMGYVA